MNIWLEREKALEILAQELASEREVLDDSFQVLEYIAQALHSKKRDLLAQITGLIAAKAYNLLHCLYGMTLDGHAQEAGALARVLLEAIELLEYLRLQPTRTQEFLHGTLPTAGKRARIIEADSKELRDYWSRHASHLGTEIGTPYMNLRQPQNGSTDMRQRIVMSGTEVRTTDGTALGHGHEQ